MTSRSLKAGLSAAAMVLTLSGSLGINAAFAQEFRAPRIESRQLPLVPADALGNPVEGWAKLRFSVMADGSVSNARVMDIMPPQMPRDVPVQTARDWTFEPGTRDGEPIDWHNFEYMLVFDSATIPFDPSPTYAGVYVAIQNLIDTEEFVEAAVASDVAQATALTRLRDIGLASAQAAIIYFALDDLHSAYKSALRATDPRIPGLLDAELALSLIYRFGIESQLGRAVEAIETYERMNARGFLEEDDAEHELAQRLRDALSDGRPIVIQGRIDEEPWQHSPSRRTIAIEIIDVGIESERGRIDTVEIECNARRSVLEYMPDTEWTLPESIGDCTLLVKGAPGTFFTLYEFE